MSCPRQTSSVKYPNHPPDDAVSQVYDVLCQSLLIWIVETVMVITFLDLGLDLLTGLSNVELTTLAGDAVYSLCLQPYHP